MGLPVYGITPGIEKDANTPPPERTLHPMSMLKLLIAEIRYRILA